MTILTVPLSQLRPNLEAPSNIRTYVNAGTWSAINAARSEANVSSNCGACAVEWLCCLLIFPIIPFLFHPCCVTVMSRSVFQNSLDRISFSVYGRVGVLHADYHNLYINTGLMTTNTANNNYNFNSNAGTVVLVQQPNQYYGQVQQQAGPDYATPVTAYATVETQSQPSGSNKYAENAYPVAVPVSAQGGPSAPQGSYKGGQPSSNPNPVAGSRVMKVTIPQGSIPGQKITAISPEGIQVQVNKVL